MISIVNLDEGKPFLDRISGANTKQLQHYIMPTLQNDKPDAVIIHVGTNDILQKNQNEKEIANYIF